MKRTLLASGFAICIVLFGSSCTAQDDSTDRNTLSVDTTAIGDSLIAPHPYLQPMVDLNALPVVRLVHEDRKGNIWFAGSGTLMYNGDSLERFTVIDTMGGVTVHCIVEDEWGVMWFGTHLGLAMYDGVCFTPFFHPDGMGRNNIWSLELDSEGMLWVGSLAGVSMFDGKTFTDLELPASQPDPTRGVTSAHIVHCIFEDSKGRMWFTNNGGLYIWEGKYLPDGKPELRHISERDGLCNNGVGSIYEAKNGDFWFGTHHNGVCIWNGDSFRHITEKDGVQGHEAGGLMEDLDGNIWFVVEHHGAYRYNGKTFEQFHTEQGLTSGAVFGVSQTSDGHMWFHGNLALYRYDGTNMMQVGVGKPWWGDYSRPAIEQE